MSPNYFRTFGRFGRNILLRNVHQQKQQSQNGPFNTSTTTILGGGALLSAFGLFKSAGNKKEEEVKLPGSEDLIIREADMLYENYLIDNTYNVLRRYRSSENPEFLWRLARVIYEQGNLTKNGDEKKRLFDEALEYAEKALKFEPVSGSFAAHKWYAIILSSTTKLEGKKAQLAKAMDIKWHFERALELNSYDATTWHLLGFWHYSCATLSTLERYGASLLYSTPPQSTIEEALRHFERAEAIRPNFYSANNYYLGLCYEHLNRLAEAEDQLTKAFIAPVISAGDMEIHKLAYQHLKKNYKVNDEKLMEEKK